MDEVRTKKGMHLLYLTILACVRFAFYVRFSTPNFSGCLFYVSCDSCSLWLQKSQLTQKNFICRVTFLGYTFVFLVSVLIDFAPAAWKGLEL